MLRAAARSSSLLRRITAATFLAKHELPAPLITAAIVANPGRPDLAAYHSQASLLLFTPFLGQTRGYASRRPTPADDSDFSDGGKDSDDFGSDSDDFPIDDEEGLLDEDLDEDELDDKYKSD